MPVVKKSLTVCLALALVCPPGLRAQDPPSPRPPKLLVLLVVDQMRGDYYQLYGGNWTGGLARLYQRGARFEHAAYPYFNTVTCAGHATIGTGTFPSTHGMVLNGWWDRKSSRVVSCTDDPHTALIGYGDGAPTGNGNSPMKLLAPTLASELKTQRPAARIVSLSLKARSAMMLAGRMADAVTWFESDNGLWVTSTAYAQQRVPFEEQFFRANPVAADFRRVWKPRMHRKAYLYRDNGHGEKPPGAWFTVFPHRLRGEERMQSPGPDFYSAWAASPYSDAYLARLAQATVEHMGLGKGQSTDMLAVSFSALDMVGHSFGPRSHEVQDVLASLDATIGVLLAYLDNAVGPENYVVALTADHGVADIPEQLKKNGVDAGRVITNEISESIENLLKARWGPGKYIARHLYTDLYLQPGVYDRLMGDPQTWKLVRETVLAIPGVYRVFAREEILACPDTGDPVMISVKRSFHHERSGDLVLTPKQNWFFVNASRSNPPGAAATHGTGHPYDTRVPVILFGAGIRPGGYPGAASPADIAPTYAALAAIHFPKTDGRVLSEALLGAKRAGWRDDDAGSAPPPQP